MSKSIDLYLDDEAEEIISIVLENTDDFESQASCIRISIKKYLKQNYPELLLDKLKENEKRY